MSRANAALSQPPEPELGAPVPLTTPGTDLIIGALGLCLHDGAAAYAAFAGALDGGDKAEVRKAAEQLVAALAKDPLALARRIAAAVRQ